MKLMHLDLIDGRPLQARLFDFFKMVNPAVSFNGSDQSLRVRDILIRYANGLDPSRLLCFKESFVCLETLLSP